MELTITQALAAGIASLAGAIAYLYTQIRADHKQVGARLEQCESDREALWERIASMTKEIKELKNGRS